MSADGFHNFWGCFLKNIQNMFLVALEITYLA
jgi:hypothetical protein